MERRAVESIEINTHHPGPYMIYSYSSIVLRRDGTLFYAICLKHLPVVDQILPQFMHELIVFKL